MQRLREWSVGRSLPGVSGNPGGRPKGLARYVRELVGDDGRRVADFMFAVLEDERGRTEVRMEAARWLVDRGFGRAHVPVEVKQSEEPETVIFVSPIGSLLREGLEAQERELEAAPLSCHPPDADRISGEGSSSEFPCSAGVVPMWSPPP